MIFRQCSINGHMYGQVMESQSDTLSDPELRRAVTSGDQQTLQFFRALALCNTVMPERTCVTNEFMGYWCYDRTDDVSTSASDIEITAANQTRHTAGSEKEMRRLSMTSGSFNHIAYKSSSPDEVEYQLHWHNWYIIQEALVLASAHLGIAMLPRTSQEIGMQASSLRLKLL